MPGKQKYVHAQLVDIYAEATEYTIDNSSDSFTLHANIVFILICLIAWFIPYYNYWGSDLLSESLSFKDFFGLYIVMILGVLTYLLLCRSLTGKFKMEIQAQNQESFLSFIESSRNWSGISKATIHYEVGEVLESSGDQQPKIANLYSSDRVDLSLTDKRIKTLHFFPAMAPLPNAGYIRWTMFLETTTILGLKLVYKQEFK